MDVSNLVASINKQSDLKSYLTTGPDNGIKHERSQHTNEYKKAYNLSNFLNLLVNKLDDY